MSYELIACYKVVSTQRKCRTISAGRSRELDTTDGNQESGKNEALKSEAHRLSLKLNHLAVPLPPTLVSRDISRRNSSSTITERTSLPFAPDIGRLERPTFATRSVGFNSDAALNPLLRYSSAIQPARPVMNGGRQGEKPRVAAGIPQP